MARRRSILIGIAAALLLLYAIPAPVCQESDPLVQAYRKEMVFLDAEIGCLEQRLEEVQREGTSRVKQAEANLAALEEQLLALIGTVERRNEQLLLIEAEGKRQRESSEVLDSIIRQAEARLQSSGDSLPPRDAAAATSGAEAPETELAVERLQQIFTEILETLRRCSEVSNETGAFFLEKGNEVQGRIVHVGRIASFGISEQGGGALAPAGGGRLRLIDSRSRQLAARLLRGEQPETVSLYVYQPSDPSTDLFEIKSLLDRLSEGGIIGYVIVMIGITGVLLIVLRIVLLSSVSGRRDNRIVAVVARHVSEGSFEGALVACSEQGGAISRVLATVVAGLGKRFDGIENLIAESLANEQPSLERFRSAITVFAAVAPLLGLLGTVTGMIATFDVITEYGTGDPKLLSGGISEALVTTVLGLAVAIPLLLIGNLLSSWSDRIAFGLQAAAIRVVNAADGFPASDVEA